MSSIKENTQAKLSDIPSFNNEEFIVRVSMPGFGRFT